jgi:hypothetical protein
MCGVAASETRRAQTVSAEWPVGLCGCGVVRPFWGATAPPTELPTLLLVERHWNGRPERVIAP